MSDDNFCVESQERNFRETSGGSGSTKVYSTSSRRPLPPVLYKVAGLLIRKRARRAASSLRSKRPCCCLGLASELIYKPRIPRSMKTSDARPDATQPLLPRQQQQQQQGLPVADGHHQGAAAARPGRRSFPWPTVTIFGLLTFNSGMAVYRSHGDRETVAFVAFSYLDLLALFLCLRKYENAEPGSQLRGQLKIAVWLLTTALTLLFSFKVAALMPPAVAVVVWLMAFATIAGGFYAFFCYSDKLAC